MGIPIQFDTDIKPLCPNADPQAAALIIADALAQAERYADCINTPGFRYADAAKAIIRQAIVRRLDAGSGGIVQKTAGQYAVTVDTSQQRKALFWPSEINQLQKLCRDNQRKSLHSIDTTPKYPDTNTDNGEPWPGDLWPRE
ncbi:hypothetical protein [Nocardia arthritidis]|uniref:Uncharacterized protein n=1 Tax=Nocardia arthritidis TaxID=228602 RepID=A0A6G9Y564_9NOCA|nr:hypothetical protein [Nocardia arthritidis]QIS08213.1 hypothetical protein F5544_01450 [Nocardia arthritidis]